MSQAAPHPTTNGTTSKRFRGSLDDKTAPALPPRFAEAVLELEKALGVPLWLFVQNGDKHDICDHVVQKFFRARNEFKKGERVALLIESPGGDAAAAYRISKLIQQRCGFTAVIANWAKSAATLLSVGATEIVIGDHAQLGPLDAQIIDRDREDEASALDETQAFERLHAAGLEALDQTVMLLLMRTGKKLEAILPHAQKFVTETMRPLLEKVDVVRFTNRLRTLKVAEEYAFRLLRAHLHDPLDAEKIARTLVYAYPEHGFVIDLEEAQQIGLPAREPSPAESAPLDKMLEDIHTVNAFGRVVEA